MCDFHSTAWRMLGQDVQVAHLPNNSHSEMIEKAKWRDNEPNRKIIVFEAEWDGTGEVPSDGKLVRNSGECPEKLMTAIRQHYLRLRKCLISGKHLDGHFKDHTKWADVWSKAMERGFMPDFSNVVEFCGDVIIEQGATATLPVLKEVSGDVRIGQGATATLPVLEKCGYVIIGQGATLDAPKRKQQTA